ncbi:MAG TPA: endonuclease [Chitinophagales bacterium]|nr:endonuclease [Chitinophagales bacterium]
MGWWNNFFTARTVEGPSLVILIEELQPFFGKTPVEITGAAKLDYDRLRKKRVLNFKSWGKHFLIVFDGFYIRIHFLMFGSYRINGVKEDRVPKLSMTFKDGFVNFYTCAVSMFEGNPDDVYDYSVDVMSDTWNATKALKTLKPRSNEMVCDSLLDQNVFAGSGNIIKNEVLYRVGLHPESRIGALKPKQLKAMIDETRNYSLEFYALKKKNQLSRNWKIFKKKICKTCEGPVELRHTGKLDRRSFMCNRCQALVV